MADSLSVAVELDQIDVRIALTVAIERQLQNMYADLHQNHGADDFRGNWERHVVGCIGEQAVAKRYRRYWNGSIGNFKAADVGSLIQVRATSYPNGKLIVHESKITVDTHTPDDPDLPYILVTGQPPVVHIGGWLWGHEAQQEKYWASLARSTTGQPRPAFCVPRDETHSIHSLAAALRQWKASRDGNAPRAVHG